jgi:hypothetical protein
MQQTLFLNEKNLTFSENACLLYYIRYPDEVVRQGKMERPQGTAVEVHIWLKMAEGVFGN